MKAKKEDILPYLLIRIMMLFAVLFQIIWYQNKNYFDENSLKFSYWLLSCTFFITTVYTIFIDKITNHFYFVVTQLFYDALFVTALLVNTSNDDSVFSFFFFIVIMISAIWFKAKGGLIASILTAALYLWAMHLKGDSSGIRQPENFALVPTAMIAIALLTGQLVEELKKSKKKVQVLEKISEEIVDLLDSGLLITDSQDEIKKINKTSLEVLGLTSANQILLKKIDEIGLRLDYFPKVHEVSQNEKIKKILINKINLPDQQKMYVLRDLTELLTLEEKLKKQEKLASIGRLTAGVAHEIRNPIASISGAAQMISQDILNLEDSELQKLSKIIERESDRVNSLVAKLLTLTKPTKIKKNNFNLKTTAIELIESYKTWSEVREKNIQLQIQFEGESEIHGSKERFVEILSNLITNSIHSLIESINESKVINISIKNSNHNLQIKVVDNGIGISKEAQKQIFTPFFTTKTNGTGLGLAQVHKIISEFDGSIEVKSDLGKGAEFLLKIPV